MMTSYQALVNAESLPQGLFRTIQKVMWTAVGIVFLSIFAMSLAEMLMDGFERFGMVVSAVFGVLSFLILGSVVNKLPKVPKAPVPNLSEKIE